MALTKRHLPYLVAIATCVVVPLILLELLIADRSSGDRRQPRQSNGADGVAPSEPSGPLAITSPKQGATIKGTRVVVRLRVDPKLARHDQVRKDDRDGLVHLHALLDEGKWDTPEHSSSSLFNAEGQTGYSALVDDVLVYEDIPPGRHRLRVELVHNDHVPGSGIAEAALEFTTVR